VPVFVMLARMRTVLVHGLAGSSRWWRRLEPHLGPLELDPVDLPSLPSDALEEWLAARLEPRAALVGHSLGALLAARVAARRPDLVDRLVLVAPAGATKRSLVGHALPLARALAAVRPRFAPTLVRDALRAGPVGLWGGARSATGTSLRAALADVRVPTLVVVGGRDPLAPAAEVRRCTDARVEVIPGAGHVPMVERPEELSRLLREFLLAAR
jgi:pimeloyl-ACP methyl ester carboxylesterase